MTRYLPTLLLTLSLLFVTNCDRDRPHETIQTSAKSYKLLLFASYDCHPCKEELPLLSTWYDSYKYKQRIVPSVLLVAGPGNKPTNGADAVSFRDSLGISFDVVADRYARTYKKYYVSGTSVPATVLLSEKDEVVKIFPPGKVTGQQIEETIK